MSLLQRSLACLMLGGLVGCVPWPHHQLTAPRITGTVIHAGRPVVGVRVQLADVMSESGDAAATAQKQETVTDAQGRFSIGPLRRLSWHGSVPVFSVSQHTIPWGLRLAAGTSPWKAGWLSDPTLYGDIPSGLLLATCDIDAPGKSSVVKGAIALVGNGPCELAVSESKK